MNELLEDSINVFIQKCPQVSDFPKVCRVCLSQSALHPIFKFKKDISEKIRQCSRIFIKRGDGLPDKICEGCVSLLKTALHFRALSESSDSRLREAIALKQDKKVKKKRGKHFSKDEIDTPLIEVKSEITTDEECEEDNVEVEESGTEATPPSKEAVRPSRAHECEYSSRAVEKSPSGKEGSHYECVVCTQRCPDSAGLTSHMADQHGKHAEYSCHGCDLTFKSKGLRLLHERRHCPKMPPGTNYQCRKCPAVLVTRTQLNQHARRHEGGAGATLELGELHACPVCHKTFSTKTHFKKHLKVHEATTPLTCEICGKLARTKGGMHNHMKTHSERLLACSLCPYRTNLVQSLVLHTRHHTGEKPFACEWCAHRSISMSNLQKHRLIHTGERKYECSECHKTYNAKQTLMLHMNSHLGLRPYCCHKCGKEYTRPSHLRTHIQRQHPEESSSQRKVKPFNNEKSVPPDLPKQ